MIYRYLLVVVAVATMLVGVQGPHFIDLYSNRVDAQLATITAELAPAQQIADKQYNGSLDVLVQKTAASTDTAVRAEAAPIKLLVDRQRIYRQEKISMQGDIKHQALHLASRGNREIRQEIYDNYKFNAPLTQESIIFGAVLVLAAVVLMEILALAGRVITGNRN